MMLIIAKKLKLSSYKTLHSSLLLLCCRRGENFLPLQMQPLLVTVTFGWIGFGNGFL